MAGEEGERGRGPAPGAAPRRKFTVAEGGLPLAGPALDRVVAALTSDLDSVTYLPKAQLSHFANTINYYHVLMEGVPQLHAITCHTWGECKLLPPSPSPSGPPSGTQTLFPPPPRGSWLPPPTSTLGPPLTGQPPPHLLLQRST